MQKQSRWAKLFSWRQITLGREVQASDLSCESLAYEDTPESMDDLVTAFRHLRTDARESAVRGYYRK